MSLRSVGKKTNTVLVSLNRECYGLHTTLGLAVRAGILCYFSRNRSPDLVEDEVKFF
jgi:hypothetical protein